MRILILTFAVLATITSSAFALSKGEVADLIIQESIAEYRTNHGNCPCPFNRAKNGSSCGKRSAWSKPGGQEPICYREDVTDTMIKQFLSSQ